MPKLILNTIVKDEAHCILIMLESAAKKSAAKKTTAKKATAKKAIAKKPTTKKAVKK